MNLSANPRVLLVDDDDLIRDMYRRVLGRQFDVQMANSGAEALELIRTEGPFAVIMSDFQMPGMSGIELLRQVRTLAPDTSRILLTGRFDLPELLNETDFATVLSKPCGSPQLVEALKREVEAYQNRSKQRENHDA